MAYNLQIVDNEKGFNLNVKYQNLSKYKRPPVKAHIAREGVAVEVKERTVFQGQVLGPGSTQRKWVDDQGNAYDKSELSFTYEGEPVEENKQTKVLQITDYEPLKDYTDRFVIDKFYEVFPSDNKMKSDFDRQLAVATNSWGMRKLWEHLKETNSVARGEFCVSSKGFVPSDGYIRAVEFGTHWGLEIGVFKEKKIFEHLQEGIPQKPQEAPKKKKLKMV